MQMGGTRIPVRNNTGSSGYAGNSGGMGGISYSNESTQRFQRDEEERQRRQREGELQRIIASMYGNGGSQQQGAPTMGGGAPYSSEFGALNYSYKGGPDTPQYHLEIPYGGTPGIYAIRNDEIFGPKRDRLMNPPRHTGGRRRRRR